MDQYCPRCSDNKVSKSSTASVGRHAGLVGILVANAAASYSCPTCGKIPLSEFPEEFQSSVKRKRIFSVLGAAGVLVAVLVLLYFMNSM